MVMGGVMSAKGCECLSSRLVDGVLPNDDVA